MYEMLPDEADDDGTSDLAPANFHAADHSLTNPENHLSTL